MKETNVVSIVFIGQVDHGKSSLIARLASLSERISNGFMRDRDRLGTGEIELAHLTDQLTEERENAMTIDTTELRLSLKGRTYKLIDAPGHLELLRNMVVGTSRSDAALLVIDAEEGVTSQTLRHMSIAALLGCRRLVIAINKMDLVCYDQHPFRAIVERVNESLQGTGFERSTVVPISARENEGVDGFGPKLSWYEGPSLIECFSRIGPDVKSAGQDLCFSVQDLFQADRDRLVLGRVVSGTITLGNIVRCLPVNKSFIVDEIIAFPKKLTHARTGESVALRLKADGGDHLPTRGSVLVDRPESITLATKLTGRVVWLDDLPLKAGDELRFKCATQSVIAKINKVDGAGRSETLRFGDLGHLEFTLNEPVAADLRMPAATELHRFVLERQGKIVSGGICCA